MLAQGAFFSVLASLAWPGLARSGCLPLILPISPRSLGSGMLYQRFVHRYLVRREGEIDRAIMQFKEQGYASVTQGGKKVFHYVMNAICNFMINAPVYAAEFVQKYGFVNS